MSEQTNPKAEEQPRLPEFVLLYRRAFAEYKAQALWNMRVFETPTPEDALVVEPALHVEGNMQARAPAEQIERLCAAAV